jgi:hypothetical protein
MTKSPRKTGSGRAASKDAGETAQTNDTPASRPAAAAARPSIATTMSEGTSTQYQAPPQGPGAPARLRHDGSPHSEARLNAAMKVLLDPASRSQASRVYSGQTRNWRR